MVKYRTKLKKISQILTENLSSLKNNSLLSNTENNFHISLDNVYEESKPFIIINLKEEKDEVLVLIEYDANGGPNKQEDGFVKGHINQVIELIDSNLNDNEKTESSKNLMKTIDAVKNKYANRRKYGLFGLVGFVSLFFIIMISSWTFEGYVYCDGYSKSSSEVCYEFDDGIVTSHWKNPYGGTWSESWSRTYYVDKKAVTYKGEKHDIITSSEDEYWRLLIIGRPKIPRLKHISIGGEITKTYYKQ